MQNATKQPVVGFIGLGIMGEPMAHNILRAGFTLHVYNRTASRAAAVVAAGAVRHDSPAEVAKQADITIVMVTDTADVRQVILGPHGVAAAARAGSVVVDMSTVSPEIEVEVARCLADKRVDYIDAPVSGGDVGARAGTLAIMAGGSAEALARADGVLRAMGKSITHCGPVGAGQVVKLCNQILVSTTLMGVCEAVTFARQSGLDPRVMLDAVAGGAAGSWQLSNLGPKVAKEDFAPGFMIDLMQKDLRLVLGSAFGCKAPLPATSLVHQLFSAAQAHGDGRLGTQALGKVIASLAGSRGGDA